MRGGTWVVGLVLLGGCGASMHELVRADRLAEACESTSYEDQSGLLDAIEAEADVRVFAHVYTPSELEELFGSPPGFPADRYYLVMNRIETRRPLSETLVFLASPAVLHPGDQPRHHRQMPCCDDAEWAAVLSGSVAPVTHRSFFEEATERLGRAVRVLGGSSVQTLADVLYGATAGALDVRLGSVRDGIVSPRTVLEALGRDPAGTDDDEATAALVRQAQARVLLEELTEGSCELPPGQTTAVCHRLLLREGEPAEHRVLTGSFGLTVVPTTERGYCGASRARVHPLASPDTAEAFNAAFGETPRAPSTLPGEER